MDRDQPKPETQPATQPAIGEVAFLRRVLIVAALILVALLLWLAQEAVLLTFAGVVVAVLLRAASLPLEKHLGLSRSLALLAVALAIGGLVVLVAMLVGSEMLAQVNALWNQLPNALNSLEQRFHVQLPEVAQIAAQAGQAAAQSGQDTSQAGVDVSTLGSLAGRLGSLAGRAASIGGTVANAATALVVVIVGGFFLATDPQMYRNGLAMLLPRSRQPQVHDAMLVSGRALRLWLASQMISMLLIGTMAGLGTWALGLPSPLALGLFSGLMAFIPLLGAVAGAVPALLLALAEGGNTVLWTALLFIGVQQVESNMILPLVQKRLVSMPPALLMFSVVAIGMIFGLPGVLLAAPITVVCFVLVKKLYVRDTLGQETEVPGETSAASAG